MSGSLTVVIAAPFPPPTHGLSAVALSTALALETSCRVVRADLSPGGLARGLPYHAARVRRASSAVLTLLTTWRGRKNLYLAVAGGSGNIYALPLALVGRSLGYRIFLDHHSFNYLDRPSRMVAALCAVAGASSRHAVLSPRMGKRLSELYPAARDVRVVSNAARIPADATPPDAHDGPLVVGHLSNLSFEKGLGIVLDLVDRACRENMDVRFELAGPAEGEALAAIERAANRSGGRLVWHGPVYGENKRRFLRRIDLLCFPTIYKNEAQPLVLFESLAQGAPVLVYGRGCIPEDIHPELGIVVPVEADFHALALPILKDWSRDRSAMEQRRTRAWQSYRKIQQDAAQALSDWLRVLACD